MPLWFQTRAGQLIRHMGPLGMDVFDHDDPRLPALLKENGCQPKVIQRAIGIPDKGGRPPLPDFRVR